jgi:ATP-binding protein involved in chromosome partitioning
LGKILVNNAFSRAKTTARYRLMVVSAKGGVGKSTITVNLAGALSARGLQVGIFDADVHGPNVPALLGITQKRNLNMLDPEAMIPIEARPDSPDRRPIEPLVRYGLKVMSLGLLVGAQQTLNPEPEILGKMVSFLLDRIDWGGVDILLLDMPPGTGDPLNTIVGDGLVDSAVLVALREQLSHLDNGRLLSLLGAKRVPVLGVVENMTHIVCPRCGELIEMYPAPVAEQAVYGENTVLAAIPFHPQLIRQVRAGPPLALADPQSPVSSALLELADKIIALIDHKS